jgi:hypothetical protein
MAQATCATCGIETDEPLRINYKGRTSDYCCFECAITPLAPACAHCNCRVIGHGTYGDDGNTYCCQHCADQAGQGRTIHA